MTMNLTKEQIEHEIQEAKFRIASLNSGIELVKKHIEVEKAESSNLDTSIIEQDLSGIESEISRVERSIGETKDEIKRSKRIISEMKEKYESLEDDLKKDNWSILTEKSNQHHLGIMKNEAAIGALEAEKFKLYQKREILTQKLDAQKHWSGEISPGEDLRLASAIREKEEELAKLSRLQDKLTTFK